MDNNTERWMPVPGTDGHYQVSSHGRVKSVARTITSANGKPYSVRERILKPRQDKDGYWVVSVRKSRKAVDVRIHAAMLTCFVRPPEEGEVCRHLNGINTDNRLENLAWGTQRENMQDRIKHGKNTELNKTHCSRGHQLDEPNLVRAEVKRGHRSCLACSRARAYVRGNPLLADNLQAVADSYYEQIIS